MLKNGRPHSVENGYLDDKLITNRSKKDQAAVFSWIKDNIVPRKTVLHGHTSYSLKHILERDTEIYLTNNEFKDAMLLAGYEPANTNKLNWEYRISKNSPCFK